MKKRIISGAVLVLIAAIFIGAWFYFYPAIDILVSFLAAFGTYEALYKTGYNKGKVAVTVSCLYSALAVWFYRGYIKIGDTPLSATVLTVVFCVAMVGISLHDHVGTDALHAAYSILMPIALGYGFYTISGLINFSDGLGLFYILLMLNFSAVCDAGAYFIGYRFGKHKLAAVLSPKKTIEGSVGGIISSSVFTVILVFAYNAITGADASLLKFLIVTPFMCALGMLGDIFFSYIKRCCNIKDYSDLIPGHGGILDRFDSALLITPVLLMFLECYKKFI